MIRLALLAGLASPCAAQETPPPLVYGRSPQRATYAILEPGEILRDAPGAKPKPAQEAPSPADDPSFDDDLSIPIVREGRAGWVKTPASLLLYDSSGTLVNEVGLGTWEEPASEGMVLRRIVRGGISRDGRFAWSWEKAETVKLGRVDKPTTTARLMRYLGTEGQELFRNELADAPQGLEPIVLSDNGERLLLAEHGPDAWILAAYDFTGNRLVDARAKGSIELAELTANGRFALVRWHQLDLPPEYTLLRIEDRMVSDLPGVRATGISPKLTDDGRVLVGKKVVFPAP